MRKYLTLLALVASQPAISQESPEGWSIGGIVAAGQSIYVGETAGAIALPSISYKQGDWEFGLNGISANLYDEGASKITFLIRPRFPEFSPDDTPELNGLEQNVTGDAGAKWTYRIDSETTFELTAVQEVTDAHNGQEVEFFIERKVQLGPVPIWASASLNWQSSNLSDYLYGVSASEARSGRPAYNPGAVLIPSVALTSGYPLGDKAFLFGVLGYRVLPSEVTDSPIIDRDDELSLITGISYSF